MKVPPLTVQPLMTAHDTDQPGPNIPSSYKPYQQSKSYWNEEQGFDADEYRIEFHANALYQEIYKAVRVTTASPYHQFDDWDRHILTEQIFNAIFPGIISPPKPRGVIE